MTEKCKHENTSVSWDWRRCRDCGAIETGGAASNWGIASFKWFKSVDEAKFYKANGKLPETL